VGFTTIFCGHFPDGTVQFTEKETIEETRGQWYYRQCSARPTLTGGRLFHTSRATSATSICSTTAPYGNS
jgi:hypothetical protein